MSVKSPRASRVASQAAGVNFSSAPPTRARTWEFKETVRCTFCGGPNCKRCGPDAYLNCKSPPIEKFHCNWITDNIMAMQRPSDELFQKINLLEKFKMNGITAVFNLTEPGEHPFCGYGISSSSGFPYNPEKLMAVGIKHFNYFWRDMTVPSSNLMMDLVHVAVAELNNGGKIAVHCHAGFGRTGTAIACVMVALSQAATSGLVISIVRMKRPGSVQTASQEGFIRHFETIYRNSRLVFPTLSPAALAPAFQNAPQAIPTTTTTPLGLLTAAVSSPSTNRIPAGGLPPTGNRNSARVSPPVPTNPTTHKTISQSIRDQQYVLPIEELAHLRWVAKPVILALTAIKKELNRNSSSGLCDACSVFLGFKIDVVKVTDELESNRESGSKAHTILPSINRQLPVSSSANTATAISTSNSIFASIRSPRVASPRTMTMMKNTTNSPTVFPPIQPLPSASNGNSNGNLTVAAVDSKGENSSKTMATRRDSNLDSIIENENLYKFTYYNVINDYDEELILELKKKSNLNDWSDWGRLISVQELKNILLKTLSLPQVKPKKSKAPGTKNIKGLQDISMRTGASGSATKLNTSQMSLSNEGGTVSLSERDKLGDTLQSRSSSSRNLHSNGNGFSNSLRRRSISSKDFSTRVSISRTPSSSSDFQGTVLKRPMSDELICSPALHNSDDDAGMAVHVPLTEEMLRGFADGTSRFKSSEKLQILDSQEDVAAEDLLVESVENAVEQQEENLSLEIQEQEIIILAQINKAGELFRSSSILDPHTPFKGLQIGGDHDHSMRVSITNIRDDYGNGDTSPLDSKSVDSADTESDLDSVVHNHHNETVKRDLPLSVTIPLFFDWLDTRIDAIFDETILAAIYPFWEQTYSYEREKQLSNKSMALLNGPDSPDHSATPSAAASSSYFPSLISSSSSSAGVPKSQPSSDTSVITSTTSSSAFPPLSFDINTLDRLIKDHMSRHRFSMLTLLVDLLRFVHHLVMNSSTTQIANKTAEMWKSDNARLLEVERLIYIRFAICCIQAQKKKQNLFSGRSLNVEALSLVASLAEIRQGTENNSSVNRQDSSETYNFSSKIPKFDIPVIQSQSSTSSLPTRTPSVLSLISNDKLSSRNLITRDLNTDISMVRDILVLLTEAPGFTNSSGSDLRKSSAARLWNAQDKKTTPTSNNKDSKRGFFSSSSSIGSLV